MGAYLSRQRLERWRSPGVAALVAAVCIGVLIWHVLRYPTFFFDDSFISLRYADRLRSGHGLTWTDGERVEGYSNLLWVLLIAAIGTVSPSLIDPTRIVGTVCTGLCIVALVVMHRPRRLREVVVPLYAGLALALSGPVAAWSVGGLEAPLLIALLAWAIALLYPKLDADAVGLRDAVGPGVLLGLVCLTRPDGALFTATLCLGLVIARGRLGFRLALPVAAISAAFFLGQLGFRRLYYHAWLPNTSSKLETSKAQLHVGIDYVTNGIALRVALLAVAATTLLLVVNDRTVRRRVALLFPSFAAWIGYQIAIGGDFMPQVRHLVPALLLVVLIAAEGIRWIANQKRPYFLGAWLLGAASLGRYGWAQQHDWNRWDAENSAWYWQGRPIGLFFRDAFGDKQALLAVDAAGALPFFYRGPALDMLGLNDRYIATHPPKHPFGPVGHQLGDGKYVWSRKPDLIVFHLPVGRATPMWRGDWELYRQPGFARTCRLIHYETVRPYRMSGEVFVRQLDGPLGVQREGGHITVPGYLFGAAEAPATLDDQDRVALRLDPGKNASLAVSVPSGAWSMEASASAHVMLSVIGGRAFASGTDHVDFTAPDGANAMTTLRVANPSDAPVFVYRITLAPRAL